MKYQTLKIEKDYFDTLILNLYQLEESLMVEDGDGFIISNRDSDMFANLLMKTLYEQFNVYGIKDDLTIHSLYQFFREVFKDNTLEEALAESQIIYERWGGL